MGKIEKGVQCSVAECSGKASRSISVSSASGSNLKISAEGRRAYLCEVHFKEWKKQTKKSRELDRLRYG